METETLCGTPPTSRRCPWSNGYEVEIHRHRPRACDNFDILFFYFTQYFLDHASECGKCWKQFGMQNTHTDTLLGVDKTRNRFPHNSGVQEGKAWQHASSSFTWAEFEVSDFPFFSQFQSVFILCLSFFLKRVSLKRNCFFRFLSSLFSRR